MYCDHLYLLAILITNSSSSSLARAMWELTGPGYVGAHWPGLRGSSLARATWELTGQGYVGAHWPGLRGSSLARATWELTGQGYVGLTLVPQSKISNTNLPDSPKYPLLQNHQQCTFSDKLLFGEISLTTCDGGVSCPISSMNT